MEQEEFYVEGEFIFSSYDPPKLIQGMHFLTKRMALLLEPEFLYFTLDFDPSNDDSFKSHNGAPVVMNIITTGEDGEIIALQDEIGYFSDEDGVLHPITEEQINTIINQYDGKMNVESDETGDPILYEGKVIISYLSSPENEEES